MRAYWFKKGLLPLLLSSVLSVLTGCGFHLRGAPPIPASIHEIAVTSSSPYDNFTLQLKQVLSSIGISVVPIEQHPPIILAIDNQTFSSNSYTQSASSSVQQYIMYYYVTYHISDSKNNTIFGPKSLRLSDIYSLNQNQALSTDTVEQSIQQQLQQDAVYELITQLNSKEAQTALNKASVSKSAVKKGS